ncbi:hypothetical protein LTR08_008279 [Meristemomyces frigidus]|nr:hypothetical protein LTR08_008279 [Meristemomyces frigidus]
MSPERAPSAVRNLRSLFENKAGDRSPDSRGRSRSGLPGDSEHSRPTSSIRANFVSVDRSGGMATAMENGVGAGTPELKRESSAGLRRGSFTATEGSDDGGLLDMRKTVSQEADRREQDSNVAEAIPEAAVESAADTPVVHASKAFGDDAVEDSPLAGKEEKEPAHPDKSTSAAEETSGHIKSAEPTSEDAVSGGSALPPVQTDKRPNGHAVNAAKAQPTPKPKEHKTQTPATKSLDSAVGSTLKTAQKSTAKPAPHGKPSPITIKSPAKLSASSIKSPANMPKSPLSAKSVGPTKTESPKSAPVRQPSKKASRSSLTAPTASSVAKASGSDRTISTSSKQSTSSKPKPREGTKAIDLPSRLTAPTAASRAKHDLAGAAPGSNGSTFNGKASTTSRPRPHTSSARPTPRSSLGHSKRPESRTSQVPRKPAAPADGSFLERMMRPTAASSSKLHEKTEPKSPPHVSKTAPPPKPKLNGHAKKPSAGKTHSRPSTAKSSGTEKTAVEPAPASAAGSAHEASANGDMAEVAIQAANDELEADPPADLPVTHGVLDESDGKDAADETPTPRTNGHANGALEATPAAIGGEETIR